LRTIALGSQRGSKWRANTLRYAVTRYSDMFCRNQRKNPPAEFGWGMTEHGRGARSQLPFWQVEKTALPVLGAATYMP